MAELNVNEFLDRLRRRGRTPSARGEVLIEETPDSVTLRLVRYRRKTVEEWDETSSDERGIRQKEHVEELFTATGSDMESAVIALHELVNPSG